MKSDLEAARNRLAQYLSRRSRDKRLSFEDIHSFDAEVHLTASDVALVIDALEVPPAPAPVAPEVAALVEAAKEALDSLTFAKAELDGWLSGGDLEVINLRINTLTAALAALEALAVLAKLEGTR